MAKEKLSVAVAGAGAFGREHLRTLSAMEAMSLVGVADIDRAAVKAAAERFGAQGAYTDAIEMLERLKPDGCVIATPGHTHVAMASAALRLGIPTLLEKPVGLSAADADILIEEESKSRAFVIPGHILRFSAPYRTLVDIARSGEIGRVLSVSARNHRDETHAIRYPDIDPVLMTMVHEIDFAIWITGAALASVFALRRPEGTSRSETLMTAADTRGSMWHISNAWTYPTLDAPPDRVEIVCENGSMEMELGAYIRVFGKKCREIDLSDKSDDMLMSELSHFASCIEAGQGSEVISLKDARTGLSGADAIMESLRTGNIVRR